MQTNSTDIFLIPATKRYFRVKNNVTKIRQRPISLEEFATEPLIQRDAESAVRMIVTSHLNQLGLVRRMQPRMELTSNEAVKATIRAGLGVGFLPTSAIAAELQAGTVARVRVDGLCIRRSLSVIYRKGEEREPAVGALLAFLGASHVGGQT